MENVAFTMIAMITLTFLLVPFLNRILRVSGTNFLIKYKFMLLLSLIRQFRVFCRGVTSHGLTMILKLIFFNSCWSIIFAFHKWFIKPPLHLSTFHLLLFFQVLTAPFSLTNPAKNYKQLAQLMYWDRSLLTKSQMLYAITTPAVNTRSCCVMPELAKTAHLNTIFC